MKNKLHGIVKIDELYIHSSTKDRSYHEIIRYRMPRVRGIKHIEVHLLRLSNCNVSSSKRSGNTILDIPIHYDSMASLVCNRVSYTVYTDECRAYKVLKELNISIIQ